MSQKFMLRSAIALLAALTCSPAYGEGLSRDQGDVIISELRQIRQLLEKQPKGEALPAAPAPPQRGRLKLGKEFALGRPDAPVVIVEYTDYQCPFCNRFSTTTFPELKKKYIDTGKVRFISRDYPLDFHPHSLQAAQATRCAGEQNRFWQVKEALMASSAQLTPELITSLARDAGVEKAQFQACMDAGKYQAEIKDGIAAANAIGINGTPSFLIGKVSDGYLDGRIVIGAQPLGEFEKVFGEIESGEKK